MSSLAKPGRFAHRQAFGLTQDLLGRRQGRHPLSATMLNEAASLHDHRLRFHSARSARMRLRFLAAVRARPPPSCQSERKAGRSPTHAAGLHRLPKTTPCARQSTCCSVGNCQAEPEWTSKENTSCGWNQRRDLQFTTKKIGFLGFELLRSPLDRHRRGWALVEHVAAGKQ